MKVCPLSVDIAGLWRGWLGWRGRRWRRGAAGVGCQLLGRVGTLVAPTGASSLTI